jgi:DNA-binding transcriptional MerR regulator
MERRATYSIGEVLDLLLEEFPDVTISKIRFLESQGLIEPERSRSGYRQFSEVEIERLRFILREQRENYLPLRVIRDRLDGETSGDITIGPDESAPAEPPPSMPRTHPAARVRARVSPAQPVRAPRSDVTASLSRDDLLAESGVPDRVLEQVIGAGLVSAQRIGAEQLFSSLDREIVILAARFIDLGIDARHLRTLKLAVDREATLYEQRILPLLKQRNPAARAQGVGLMEELATLGDDLRRRLMESALRQVGESR